MQFSATSVIDKTGHPFVKVISTDDNNKSTIRTLTITQFISILGGSTVEEREYVRLKDDFFPKTAKATYFSDYSNYSCVWEVPAKNRLLILNTALGEKHFHVPFPKLVFRIVVRNGIVTSKECFAMKNGTDKLYHYPFGNVSSYGSICMGNIAAGEMSKVSDFSDAFFSGITNNDYYGSDGNGKVSVQFTQEQLLEKLSKQKSFPDSFLVEDGEGRTLKTLCDIAPSSK